MGADTPLLSLKKGWLSTGDIKMLFRTSVLRCFIQRGDCCAGEQGDPICTKQDFSHRTFCFQNILEYSEISGCGAGKNASSRRREELTEGMKTHLSPKRTSSAEGQLLGDMMETNSILK